MPEPTLYQADRVAMDDLDRDAWYRMMERGVLVLVKRCDHHMIDPHEVTRLQRVNGLNSDQWFIGEWCRGAVIGDTDER